MDLGPLTTRKLADTGNIVYASMRETTGRNAPQVQAVVKYAKIIMLIYGGLSLMLTYKSQLIRQ